MKEFTNIEELAQAKTKEEIVTWAAEMQKCPYDFGGEAFEEGVCKEGADAEQCNECWRTALKNVKCKGDEEKPKRKTRKDKPSDDLAAKDSNKGVLALKDLCKTMTREEFPTDKQCPKMYGFPDTMNACNGEHKIPAQCKDCWKVILDGIEFATTEEAPVGEAKPDTTDLITSTNTDMKLLTWVDNIVEETLKLKASMDEWDAMLKAKIESITSKVNDEKGKLQRAIDYNMAQIKTQLPNLQLKDSKTQQSLKTVSGQIVVKKATQKLEADKEKLLTFAKANNLNQFIKVKEEFNWAEYKKGFSISDGHIINTATGETVSLDGLSIVDVEEKLEVK